MNLRSLFFLLGITAAACEGERGEMGEPGAPGEMGEPGEPGECGAAGELHVPGPSAFPEGIAAAPDGALYVGSLTSGEVVAFDPCDAAPRRFADVGDASAVGMLADAESDALWVCAADAAAGADPEVVGFALADGAELARHPFAGGAGFCNDLALDGEGNLYATDSFGDRLMVIAAADLMTDGSEATEWLSDPAFASEGFGLNGIAIAPAGSIYVSKFDTGELFRVDIEDGGGPTGLTEVAVEPALAGPDGLELLEDGALLVVEGFANRLSAVTFDGEAGTSTVVSNRLDGPTTAAIAGDAAWVVEGQVSDLIAGSQPDVPFRIVRVPL